MRLRQTWVLLLPFIISCTGRGTCSLGTYEAESGRQTYTVIQTDTTASGGKFLSLADSSEVTWDVEVDLYKPVFGRPVAVRQPPPPST